MQPSSLKWPAYSKHFVAYFSNLARPISFLDPTHFMAFSYKSNELCVILLKFGTTCSHPTHHLPSGYCLWYCAFHLVTLEFLWFKGDNLVCFGIVFHLYWVSCVLLFGNFGYWLLIANCYCWVWFWGYFEVFWWWKVKCKTLINLKGLS